MKKPLSAPVAVAPNLVALDPIKQPTPIPRIIDFFVTTDSIIACATIVVDAPTRRIRIDWGDGQADTLRLPPGALVVDRFALGENPLEPGTYQFEHEYALPDEVEPFPRLVIARVDEFDGNVDFRQQWVNVAPKYRVNHYASRVILNDNLEPPWDSVTELNIRMKVDGNTHINWSNDVGFLPGNGFKLNGSQLEHIYDLGDEDVNTNTPRISYHVWDADPFSDDDYYFNTSMAPSVGTPGALSADVSEEILLVPSGTSTFTYHSVLVKFWKEVRLLKPRKNQDNAVFAQVGAAVGPVG